MSYINGRGKPETIEELQNWYADKNLPPYETTRFFIGEDHKGPKAFGIYRDGSNIIVYKNKSDGSRAIRYEGTDEVFAVNEIFLKLKAEIIEQKSRQGVIQSGGSRKTGTGARAAKSSGLLPSSSSMKKTGKTFFLTYGFLAGIIACAIYAEKVIAWTLFPGILVLAFIIYLKRSHRFQDNVKKYVLSGYLVYVVLILTVFSVKALIHGGTRYYRYNDDIYCNYGEDYYYYDDYTDDYLPVDYESVPSAITDNPSDYLFDSSSTTWEGEYDFTSSDYYRENISPSSSYGDSDSSWYDDSDWDDDDFDWDDDYDWDSDSDWGSGSDWDDDW